jgi:hypothetical protein
MGPSEGRDVRQEVWGTIQPCAFSLRNSFTKLICVPVNNDSGEKVKASHTIMLTFGSAIPDFTLPPDPQRIF